MNVNTEDRHDVIVVGGGLAGLTAATVAARQGRSVLLVDARNDLGGRARTEERDGFSFNQGPHALYSGGAARRILRTLRVRPKGGIPPVSHGYLVEHGALLSGRRPSTVGWPFLGAITAAMRPGAVRDAEGKSLSEWLDGHVDDRSRTRMEAMFRVTSYLADTDHVDASAALTQLRRGARGVTYLHGGWSTLVDELRRAATVAGVRIESGSKVDRVDVGSHDGATVTVGDRAYDAHSVILANGGPGHAARLLDGTSTLVDRWATSARPVPAACLDVSLRRLPVPEHTALLGADRPTYLIVHSEAARLTPTGGGALIHAMRYGPDLDPDHDHRGELEDLLDLAQPGWRSELVHAQWGQHLMVAHDRPQPGVTIADRPDVVTDLPAIFVAGDWITTDGLLADAAVGSGARAAHAAVAHTNRVSDTRTGVVAG